AAPCDVLLLDEPTNHLDVAARVWLERHPAARPGALVGVSPDRARLTAATNATASAAAGRGTPDPCGDHRPAGRAAAADATAAAPARAARREAQRPERVAAELARHGRRSRARERRAAELAGAADAAAAGTTGGAAGGPRLPGAEAGRRRRGLLLAAERLVVPGLLDVAAVRLSAGESVALMGPNGRGQSTPPRLLAGQAASADPRSRLA